MRRLPPESGQFQLFPYVLELLDEYDFDAPPPPAPRPPPAPFAYDAVGDVEPAVALQRAADVNRRRRRVARRGRLAARPPRRCGSRACSGSLQSLLWQTGAARGRWRGGGPTRCTLPRLRPHPDLDHHIEVWVGSG